MYDVDDDDDDNADDDDDDYDDDNNDNDDDDDDEHQFGVIMHLIGNDLPAMCLSVYLSVCLSVCVCVSVSVCVSVFVCPDMCVFSPLLKRIKHVFSLDNIIQDHFLPYKILLSLFNSD